MPGNNVSSTGLSLDGTNRSHQINSSCAEPFDAGNALDELNKGLNNELQKGAGFGVRWNSPVGPMRFDLATALSLDGQPWRLHINFGPDL